MIRNYFLLYSRKVKQLISILADSLIIILSFIISMLLRLDNFDFLYDMNSWSIIYILLPTNIIIFYILGIYNNIVRHTSIISINKIFLGIFLTSLFIFIIDNIYNFYMPRSVPFIYLIFCSILASGIRLYTGIILSDNKSISIRENIIIYGAGEAGIQLLNAIRKLRDYNPVAFIDDDIKLQNTLIDGIKVYKNEDLENLIKKQNVKSILLSIPSLSPTKKTQIINKLETFDIKIKSIPNLNNIILGKSNITDFDYVSVSEILTRETVAPDKNLISINTLNKNVLITGAGGSIGSELCRQIINENPRCIVLFDLSEYALYKIYEEIKTYVEKKKLSVSVVQVLGNVRSLKTVKRILSEHKIETIYHAAAYKHVPLLEENIIEGISNNVFGTNVLIKCAIECEVNSFTLISTDKAVRPTNIMGASKRIGEILCQAAAKEQKKTTFSIVRFGNVLDSSGSVVPRFRQQIKNGGPVTVTHKDVTRYFMTIPEAAQLVIQAGAMASDGANVFVLDMGKPFKILDLAKRMIRLHGYNPYIYNENKDKFKINHDIEIIFTGLRNGEKLYEELLIGNNPQKTKHPRIISCYEESLDRDKIKQLLSNLEAFCNNYSNHNEIYKILTESKLGYRVE